MGVVAEGDAGGGAREGCRVGGAEVLAFVDLYGLRVSG